MARSFNTTRTAAFLFCLVGGFVPALGADLTVSANDKRAIEDLVQKFNQAVNSRKRAGTAAFVFATGQTGRFQRL